GSAVRAGFEIDVPHPALAPLGEQRCLLVGGEVGNRLSRIGIRDDSSDWNAEKNVFGAFPAALAACAVLSIARAMYAGEPIVDQRIDVAVGDGVDAAATAAVTTVGPATRHEFFAPEADDAVPALAGVNFDTRFIYEFHRN